MAVTQADVARRAGVSQRTVSNVVNKFPYVSADVVARVNEAIAELGYAPSQAARSLRSGRSRVIQLVVPELDVPYFAELARGVVRAADDRGFGVMVRQTLGDPRREQEALEGSAADYAEGTILSAVGPVESLVGGRARPPVVLIGERSGQGLADHIGIDDVAAAAAATTHLLESGRRRVAFIGADPVNSLRMAEMRMRGYQSALEAAGSRLEEELIVRTRSYHRADGASGMGLLLDTVDPPDAVFCATDLLALGALHSARERGVRVPEDVAVIGFDGLEEGLYSAPTLSTIAPDKRAIAAGAVALLLARIDARNSAGGEPEPQDQVIPFEVVVRESSRRR
jgi:DNA-binding LacI/PurR family transcriptional regulator